MTDHRAAVVMEIRIGELKQIFNSMDPSPFRERDLDPKAAEFIIEWAEEAPHDAPLELLVHVGRAAGEPDEGALLQDAVRMFFKHSADESRRRLRQLFRRGRTSLMIGLGFLTVSILIGREVNEVLRESLLIGGWVAMWRPLEVFLYDWWPIRSETRLLDRLARLTVRIAYMETTATEAWRHDWPAESHETRS